ncbi:Myb-like_DNA-binding domain-containing protein [Hexamita inflata]|uniref:Myb-like DNA-binding domain-containing protein n=1 Tax=Hexamita inflata TaxID=28002 RepID=A0AA86PCT4_9EUKA|nr:Myb-like DNA-binding domain-containing protein [Hexamita inflata]
MKCHILKELQQLLNQQETIMSNLNKLERKLQYSENSQWTQHEHHLFIQGINTYGKTKQKEVAEYIQTKNTKQVSSHSQKFFSKLQIWYETNVTNHSMIPEAEQYFKQYGLSAKVVSQFILELQTKSQ